MIAALLRLLQKTKEQGMPAPCDRSLYANNRSGSHEHLNVGRGGIDGADTELFDQHIRHVG